MHRAAAAAACVVALALAGQGAHGHDGSISVAGAEVTGPGEITVEYTGALGASEERCAGDCPGAHYSGLVLRPGGAREVLSVSAEGSVHVISFGGPAAKGDAEALLHVESALWSGGGHSHELGAASVAAGDGQPPGLSHVEISLGDGRALFVFDEEVDASRTDPSLVTVGGAALSGPPVHGERGDEIAIALGERARSALSALERIGVVAGAGAFADAAGNATGPLELEARVIPDGAAPEPRWERSALDLGAGTLVLAFSERIDASSLDPGAVTVSRPSGDVTLGGASVAARGYSDTVIIELTRGQKAALTGPVLGGSMMRPLAAFPSPSPDAGTASVSIASGVRDAAGLGLAGGREGGQVRVEADTVPPRIAGAPVLDLAAGTVRVEFDEHIDAYGADVSAMALVSDGRRVQLEAGGAASDGYALVARAGALASGPGGVSLELPAGSVSDLSGNALQESSVPVSVAADSAGPSAVGAGINPATGVLTVLFDEEISSISGEYLSLHEAAKPSHRIRLSGASPSAFDGQSASVTLTRAQMADVSSFRTGTVLEMSGGAVSDLSGNPSAHGSVRVASSGDSRPPAPVSASLDAGTGLLAISFDEPIEEESADAGAMELRAGGASIPLSHGDVSAESVPGAGVVLRLDELQRQWVIVHGAPVSLALGPGAARDASGNAVSREHVIGVDTDAADRSRPSPVRASLDLGSGILEITFDETVGAADPSAVSLRGGGARAAPEGALPPDGATASFRLGPGQARSISGWDGITLDAGPGAAEDTSGNASRAAPGMEVGVERDSIPPSPVAARLSGPDRVDVEFSEDLLGSSVSAADFRVGGMQVESAREEGGVVTLQLSERVRSDGGPLRVTLVGSVSDGSGNALLVHGADLPYLDAPNDLEFVGALSLTVSSDNALSSGHARAGDTITVRLETDGPVVSGSVTVNSRAAEVEMLERGLVARYAVGEDDEDGPAEVSVEAHAAGRRGGASAFSGADASGSVSIDNTAPEYLSASLAGHSSVYVHYSEPVMSDPTQYRGISVGGADPVRPAYVSGAGSDVLVEWDGPEAGGGTQVWFEIDPSVSDLAGNRLDNPGAQASMPAPSAEALALLHVPGDGRVFLAHDTFVRTVSAPDGSEPVIDVRDFGPPSEPDPAVDGAGGGKVEFPPAAIVVETDMARVTFPPGVQAGGFGEEYTITIGASEKEPDARFAAGRPGIDPGSAVVLELGSPSRDLAFSMPVLVELKDLVREESVVFSIDSGGATRELLGCDGSVNADTAAEVIASSIRPRGSATIDGWACTDKEAGVIWTVRLAAFGATVPAAEAPDCDGDCTPPTLGLSPSGARIVSDGFAYNGQAADVEEFYTPYPAVVAEAGMTNTAVIRAYDDSGTGAIARAGLAFGLREGQAIAESRAEIVWESRRGDPLVSVIDPGGAIDPGMVEAYASEAPCSPGSPDSCLLLEIIHAFAGPLEFDMVGVELWDEAGNEGQNYFEHAVRVEGGAGGGGIEVNGGRLVLYPAAGGLEVMSDGDGFLYRLAPDGTYRPLTNASGIYRAADESWRAHEGHEDRREAAFRQAVQAQALAAAGVMERMTGGTVDNPDFGRPAALQYFEESHAGRAEDAALQESLLSEQARAAELALALFGDTGGGS